MVVKWILRVFAILVILLTLFPYLSFNQWYVRIWDFPHLQIALLTLFALAFYFIKFNLKSISDYAVVLALTGCFLFQSVKIYPYTAFADKEMGNASANVTTYLSVYAANVLQKNKKVEAVVKDVTKYQSDVVLLTETNERWKNALVNKLEAAYKHSFLVPKENTYGMLLFSKYPLYETKVKYLVEDTIPSIHTKVIIDTKDTIQLFAIHPAPPTPQHNPSSVDRDAEMMKITQLTRETEYPVIVLGDFNDVAWSETTALFQRVSGLLDMRKGRGFFNTYNANSWLMRWPLDHVFASADFRVMQIGRGADIGSDHYPFYAKLSLEPKLAEEQKLPPPSKEEVAKAFEQISEKETSQTAIH